LTLSLEDDNLYLTLGDKTCSINYADYYETATDIAFHYDRFREDAQLPAVHISIANDVQSDEVDCSMSAANTHYQLGSIFVGHPAGAPHVELQNLKIYRRWQ